MLALQDQMLPAGLNLRTPDPTLAAQVDYLTQARHVPLHHVMSNSFGFGGSNACLIFGTGARP